MGKKIFKIFSKISLEFFYLIISALVLINIPWVKNWFGHSQAATSPEDPPTPDPTEPEDIPCNINPDDVTKIFPLLPECSRKNYDLNVILYLINKVIVVISWFAEVAAVFLLIYAGFLYITSAGDESKVSIAKKMIMAVVIGILIIMLARWGVLALLRSLTDDAGQYSLPNPSV